MSDYLNECRECDYYGSTVEGNSGGFFKRRWWVKCDRCGHTSPKRRFRKSACRSWNYERSEAAIKSQEEWSRKMREIFDADSSPKLEDNEMVCPACGGYGPGMWLAMGFPACMSCGGSGKIKK